MTNFPDSWTLFVPAHRYEQWGGGDRKFQVLDGLFTIARELHGVKVPR